MSTLLKQLTVQFVGLSPIQQVLSIVGSVFVGVLSYSTYFRFKEKQDPFNGYTTSSEAINGLDLTNKYAIVTGSNTGIGKETAKILYKQGCNVIIACRNIKKGNKAKQDIINTIQTSTNGSIQVMQLDLNSLASVREFAAKYVVNYKDKPLNYLINNAGIMALPIFQTSIEGYEKQFAVNHIGHFYLTQLLLPLIIKSKGRIINVSSSAHRLTSYDFFNTFLDKAIKNNNGPAQDDYNAWKNYGISKSCNVLFSRELHRRYCAQGITTCSLHPGAIMGTELARNMKLGLNAIPLVMNMFLNVRFYLEHNKSVSQGAATTLRCVSLGDNEIQSGHYYHNCRSGQNRNDKIFSGAVKDSLNKRYARTADYEKESIEGRLWTLSETLITQKGFKLTL